MPFDYKKEYKEFYLPPTKPSIVSVPAMNYLAVRGSGNPNNLEGEYKRAIELLYAIAFTIKMSKKGSHQMDGYFDYVVPPLEGFWWQDGVEGVDYAHKDNFRWISIIRLPDFVTKADFEWAISEATAKKKKDFSKVEFMTYNEGLCVQCMHIGPYDDEPATVELMHRYAEEQGYALDINDYRFHHEIYLSDARKVAPAKLRTVVRHPIKRNYLVREMRKDETPLLNNFLYEAIFIPNGATPPPKSIINGEELQVYVRDFGECPDDRCMVAEVGGKIVGAVWSRIMNDYGHMAEDTPSLAISLYKEYRNEGIGTELLRRMLIRLQRDGYENVSLSVQKENYATKMYIKAGFTIVKETAEEYIMVYNLNVNKK